MTMGKVLKLYKTIFTVLHLVVVVQFNTHNSLTRLAISTKLCECIDFHMKMCIGILNNVVIVKQQQTASGNTL